MPPKTDNPRRHKVLAVFTDEEFEMIQEAVERRRTKVATFVREASLNQANGVGSREERPQKKEKVCAHGILESFFCYRCGGRV
jgi:uncharacterized protein (DUF1778 family)